MWKMEIMSGRFSRSTCIFRISERAFLAIVGATLILACYASPSFAAYATRSLRVSGTQANPSNGSSVYGAVSSRARFVAFQSTATNLAGGSPYADVFVRDIRSASTRLVSVGVGGAKANGASVSPVISADGSRIAFASKASNLVAADVNFAHDVFCRSMSTGRMVVVSRSSAGTIGNGDSFAPSISADGRKIAFVSSSSNLVSGDTAGNDDVFVHDLATGATVRVSVGRAGAESNGNSGSPAISADGRKVAFVSSANNLVVGDTNNTADVFVVDIATRTTNRVSVSTGRAQANLLSSAPAINSNGSRVAFESLATNLVSRDTNDVRDVFVRDLATARTYRVSIGASGAQVAGESREPAISSSGNRVAFSSSASGLVTGDTNGRSDVFVRDISAAKTIRISTGAGYQANGSSGGVALAPDGVRAAFHTEASNLLVSDTNKRSDVVVAAFGPRVYDRVAGSSVYATAVEASKRGCPAGAPAVVIVNSSDWRSALAGSALAGALKGPILYVSRTGLPSVTRAEIVRLGAKKAIVVGGPIWISTSVEQSLRGLLGTTNVSRIRGGDGYAVGNAVAAEVVRRRGAGFDGTVLVASGASYTGSIAGVPLASATGRPIVFANPVTGAYRLPAGTKRAVVLGGTGSVPRSVVLSLRRRLGTSRVVRLSGGNRYETAAAIALWGSRNSRLSWDGVTLVNPTTPAAAICGGVMAGRIGSVVLATPTGPLPAATRAKLITYARRIDIVHAMGGTSAIRSATFSAAKKALGG